MKELVSGGCMCGAIRYAFNSKPKYSLICQCTQCQKVTGTGHAPAIAVTSESFNLKGTLTYFKQLANDGNTVSNGFCPTCGNPILKTTTAVPDHVYIHVGGLDEPGQFKPEFVVYSSSGHSWDVIDPELERI